MIDNTGIIYDSDPYHLPSPDGAWGKGVAEVRKKGPRDCK
jgi:hypothetical protein